jgi:uncharacterized protein with GYD domain
MATYTLLAKFTEQGIKTIKDSSKRRAAARDMAKSLGSECDHLSKVRVSLLSGTL